MLLDVYKRQEYTVLPMPYVDGVSKTSSFVNTWVIPKTAKNPELSWRVVEFLSGKEGQQIALDMNLSLIHICAYAVDFAVSAYQAYQNAHTSTEAEPVPGRAAR